MIKQFKVEKYAICIDNYGDCLLLDIGKLYRIIAIERFSDSIKIINNLGIKQYYSDDCFSPITMEQYCKSIGII